MAVTVTPLSDNTPGPFRNVNLYIVTVTATADADTTATVTFPISSGSGHFDAANTICIITRMLQVAAAISAWAMTGISGTTATLTKGTGAGSGASGPQIRAQFLALHSLIR